MSTIEKDNTNANNTTKEVIKKKEDLNQQSYGNEFEAYSLSDSDDNVDEIYNQKPSFKYQFITSLKIE